MINIIEIMKKPKSITDLSKEELEDICLNIMSIEHKKTRIISDLEYRINKALDKINNMFDLCDETRIIDDLLELEKILKGDNNE